MRISGQPLLPFSSWPISAYLRIFKSAETCNAAEDLAHDHEIYTLPQIHY